MSTDHGLKAGDKIKTQNGLIYDVLEVEGRFALIQFDTDPPRPILFDDGAWRVRVGGTPLAVAKPRWQVAAQGTTTLIYDNGRMGRHYGIAVHGNDIDGDANEVIEAIVDLLNERFPA